MRSHAKEQPAPRAPVPEIPLENFIDICIQRSLFALHGKALPIPQLCVREAEAASLLGVDVEALRSDRAEARRGSKLKFPYVRFGCRVLYKIEDLKAALDKLPKGEDSDGLAAGDRAGGAA